MERRAIVLLAAVGLFASACSSGADLEILEGAQPLPEGHTAVQLIADNASTEEVTEAAVICSAGGSTAGPLHTCLIDDAGWLVVFPLTMHADVLAVISGSGLAREFEVPLPAVSRNSLPDAGDLFGIPHDKGSVEVELYFKDEPSGAALSGPIGP